MSGALSEAANAVIALAGSIAAQSQSASVEPLHLFAALMANQNNAPRTLVSSNCFSSQTSIETRLYVTYCRA